MVWEDSIEKQRVRSPVPAHAWPSPAPSGPFLFPGCPFRVFFRAQSTNQHFLVQCFPFSRQTGVTYISLDILLFTLILVMLVCLTFLRTWCWGNHTFTHCRSHYLQVLEGIDGFIKNSKEFLRSKLPGFWALRWFFYILEEEEKKD